MTLVREFNLYLNAGKSIPLVINANQYDRGEQWVFTLYSDNGTQYTPSSGAIVGIKSDNLGIINTATVDNQGRVVVNETQQMTAAVGKATFELLIDDQTHGTANFFVLVEPKPGDNADLSESDYSLFQEAINGTSATAIAQGVSDWMDENLTPTTPVVDASLSVSGAAADAKKTGDEISDLKSQIESIGTSGSGLTTDIKQALLQLAQNVAYINANGQTYYTDLYNALYPAIVVTAITLNKNSLSFGTLNATQQLTATTTPSGGTVTWTSSNTSVATVSQTGVVTSVAYGNATITATSGSVSATCSVAVAQATVTSISAVYTQTGTVYDTDSLDSLKADLVVTATWSNQTTSTVASADYTLSGTLTEGTSTITVSYGGKTTTFNVTVTELTPLYNWDLTTGLTDTINGVTATTTATQNSSGLSYTTYSLYTDFGAIYAYDRTYQIDIGSMSLSLGSNASNIYARLWMVDSDSNTAQGGSGYIITSNKGGDLFYINGWETNVIVNSTTSNQGTYYSGKTVSFYVNNAGIVSVYVDGTLIGQSTKTMPTPSSQHVYTGSSGNAYNDNLNDSIFTGFRVYEGLVI